MTELPSELDSAPKVTLPVGEKAFRQGDACQNYYVVLEGCIRVFARSSGGKEIVLYRVEPGDICVLTTSCMLSNSPYPADATAETEVTALAVPKAEFDTLMRESESFRAFVLSSFGNRLSGLITLVEQVALESVELRLVNFLLDRSGNDGDTVEATHQEIATEIGSAREVVSRQLKNLADSGTVALSRGSVTILARSYLEQLTGP